MTDAVIDPGPEEAAAESGHGFAEKDFGFWLYLMSDAIIFALLFATYAAMIRNTAAARAATTSSSCRMPLRKPCCCWRAARPSGWRASRSPPATLAGAGVAGRDLPLGARLRRHGDHGIPRPRRRGAGPQRSGFLSAFFTLVGAHGLHVSMGLVWIVLLGGETALRGLEPHVVSRLYRLSLFWHFLDIVWIGIFSVVYLPGVL